MTSLRGSLPPAGSTLWQKERRSSSFESSQLTPSQSLITHIVIREVWKKALPSPHALYKIDVMTKSNHWFVLKRYRDFNTLHKQLVVSYGIPKDMLPPKKLTSKLSLKHLEQRRDALEHYLQRLVNSSTYVSSSPEILDFLDVSRHDVTAVTKNLANHILLVGDKVLADGGSYMFTLTELYCITKQLQLPEPMHLSDEHSSLDLGHLYSFVYNLEELCVYPNKSSESQELVSHLEFDISLFKALRSLKIDSCPVYLMKGLDSLQSQLKYLVVRYSLKTMGELLVDRVVGRRKASTHGGSAVAPWRDQAMEKLTKNRIILQPWLQLTHLTLSHNKLSTFDDSLKLLPALQSLDLRHNEFVTLDLTEMHCPSLTHLDMSHNSICSILGTSRNIPNLKSLILSYNNIEGLSCLQSLCGLIELDLTSNRVGSLKELRNLSGMLQLRYLSVDGNPLTKVKSYRAQIFSFFSGHKIVLDNKLRTADEEAAKNMWPTRSRSLSTPERPTNDDFDDIVRIVRRNSYEASPIAAVDDDDNYDDDDSGIEGFTSMSINADNSGHGDQTQEHVELEFNWSYFDFLDFGQPEIFSSTAASHDNTSRELEETIREDMCEAGPRTSSTESASEVFISTLDNSSDDEKQDSALVTLPSTTSTPLKASCEEAVSFGENLETSNIEVEEETEMQRTKEMREKCEDFFAGKNLETSNIEVEEEREMHRTKEMREKCEEFFAGTNLETSNIEVEEEREMQRAKEMREQCDNYGKTLETSKIEREENESEWMKESKETCEKVSPGRTVESRKTEREEESQSKGMEETREHHKEFVSGETLERSKIVREEVEEQEEQE